MMTTPEGQDPWSGSPPRCRPHPDSPEFRQLLSDVLGELAPTAVDDAATSKEAVLVDCLASAVHLPEARERHPASPLVGVIAAADAAQIIEVLAAGADGVIALTDPPEAWRECLNVVLGGGRWLGGPGLEISLEQKYARYDVARREDHAGEVTMRTKLFVRSRVRDRFKP